MKKKLDEQLFILPYSSLKLKWLEDKVMLKLERESGIK